MLKFIHLTDLHITGTGETHEGYDTFAATQRAFRHAIDLFPDADFIVVTGDLANWGEPAAYRRLEEFSRTIDLPLFLMIGNHDNRENFFEVFGERHPFAMPFAQYGVDFDRYRLLFLDTQAIGTHGGTLCSRRLAWLEGELAASNKDVLLFMHHHPVSFGAPSLDAKGMDNWPEFHRVLARHRGRIRHIFHGHCHVAVQGNVEGISFSGIRSMGPQAYTDLKTDQACRQMLEPHYVVALVDDTSLVTHAVEFNYAGPTLRRDRQKFSNFIQICAERGVTVPLQEPLKDTAE